uniref:Poly [ADP-ribose] polymerase n=1 Tax=Acrobeloides nanus TaxID=290746 RepID=A0A914CHX7_9BILA
MSSGSDETWETDIEAELEDQNLLFDINRHRNNQQMTYNAFTEMVGEFATITKVPVGNVFTNLANFLCTFNTQSHGLYEVGRHEDPSLTDTSILLCHGTYTGNIIPILRNGFKLSSNPMSSYGPGIYFTNSAAEAIKYTDVFESVHIILLCKVQIGKSKKMTGDKIGLNPDTEVFNAGFDSVWAPGRLTFEELSLNSDLKLQLYSGGIREREDKEAAEEFDGLYASYDEFVVYNRNLVEIRYLACVQELNYF